MGTTPNFAIPYPEVTESPNGPSQMQALATQVDTSLDGVRDLGVAHDALFDEFMRNSVSVAPTAASSQSSYPSGMCVREATTALGYPGNGLLVTHRYGSGSRTYQVLSTASSGSAVSRQWVREWGTGAAWTPWAEVTNPTSELRHTSLEVSTDVNVTATTYAEVDTLLRHTITAPPSGLATCTFGFNGLNNTVNGEMFMSVDVRRVSDNVQLIPPDDNRIAYINQQSGTAIDTAERTFLLTGMTPGVDYQIRGVYKVDAGTTGTWTRRWIVVQPSS